MNQRPGKLMDGQTRFFKIRELQTELHAGGCTDERAIAILAEIRKLKDSDKPAKAKSAKKKREQYMTVLGGYVLDMHNHGLLVGFRDENGMVRDRHTGEIIRETE